MTVYFQAPATIRQLKEALKDACNLPRFRQKLLLQQRVLADDQDLDQVLDLQLVKLSYTAATDAQIEGLLRAAADGAVDRVEDILQRPQNPNDYLRIHLEEHTDIYASALSFAARENHTDVMQLLARCPRRPPGARERHRAVAGFPQRPPGSSSSSAGSESRRRLLQG